VFFSKRDCSVSRSFFRSPAFGSFGFGISACPSPLFFRTPPTPGPRYTHHGAAVEGLDHGAVDGRLP
jgi:hypothetical protein